MLALNSQRCLPQFAKCLDLGNHHARLQYVCKYIIGIQYVSNAETPGHTALDSIFQTSLSNLIMWPKSDFGSHYHHLVGTITSLPLNIIHHHWDFSSIPQHPCLLSPITITDALHLKQPQPCFLAPDATVPLLGHHTKGSPPAYRKLFQTLIIS